MKYICHCAFCSHNRSPFSFKINKEIKLKRQIFRRVACNPIISSKNEYLLKRRMTQYCWFHRIKIVLMEILKQNIPRHRKLWEISKFLILRVILNHLFANLLCPPPGGGGHIIFAFSDVWRHTSFPLILRKSIEAVFTKVGVQDYWVSVLLRIAFSCCSSFAY